VHAALANPTNHIHKAAVLVGKKLIGNDNCVRRSTGIPADIPEKSPLLPVETSTFDAAKEKKARRDQYAVEQEQLEREEGWRDNPSVDIETQKAIIIEYRALHEQFKAEGLYQCNYSAYAWESLRYLALFAAFGYCLHIKWYITSAMFLGLFWVNTPNVQPVSSRLIHICSNKSCSQPTTLDIVASQAISSTTLLSVLSLRISAAVSASDGGNRPTTFIT
jgi:hypothetical protein